MSTEHYQPRGDELGAWDQVLTSARRDEGRSLAVAAPAGFGKSTLLDLLVMRAEAAGLLVLRTSGRLLDRGTSHSATRQLFEAVPSDESSRVFAGIASLARPLIAGGTSAADGFAQQHALFWCLTNLCERGPVAVVVDDAHWLDPASAGFLGYLVERRRELPVAVVLAGRPLGFEETDELRVAWHRSDVRITLPALRTEQVVAAAGTAAGALAPDDVDTVVALSSGNPFLVNELSRALAGGETGGLASASGRGATAVVAEFVARRTAELGSEARSLLELAAVLGDGEPWSLARELAEVEATASDAALVELHDSRLVTGGPELISFAHALVWEAVIDAVPPARRSSRRRCVGLALAEQRRFADAAAHLVASDPGGDPRVAEVLLVQARSERSRGAPGTAVGLLRRALAEPPAPEVRTDVVVMLGEVLLLVGEVHQAAEVLGRAVHEADDARRVTAARAAARALVFSGDPKAGVRLLEEVAGDLGPTSTLSGELRAEASAIGQAEHSLAAAAGNRGAAVPGGSFPDGDLGERAVVAMSAYDRVVVWDGAAQEQVRVLESLLDDAIEQLGMDAPLVAIIINGLVAGGGGGWPAARSALRTTEAAARAQGSTVGIALACTQRARLSYLEGRLLDAEADALLGVDLAARANPVLMPLAVASLVMSQTLQGRLSEAERVLREHGLAAGEVPSTAMGANLLLARVMLRREQGRLEDALADLAGTAPFARGRGPWPSSWTPEAVQTLLAAGERERAERLAREHHEQAEAWGAPVHRAEAALLLAAFDPRSAGSLLGQALDALDETPALLTRARILLALGASRRRANARTEAKELLLESLELATRTGAVPLAARVRTELAAAGVRPRRVQRSGAAALTPSELRIVRLAADGLTNPEIAQNLFVSPKTVENHLSNAYAKLGISSRRELSRIDLGGPDGR